MELLIEYFNGLWISRRRKNLLWCPFGSVYRDYPQTFIKILISGTSQHRSGLTYGVIMPLNVLRGQTRACILMNISQQPIFHIWIGTPRSLSSIYQEVIYETLPAFCSKCKTQGHNINTCRAGNHKEEKKKDVSKVWVPKEMNDVEIKTKAINEEGECLGEKSTEPVKDLSVEGGNDQSKEIVDGLDDFNATDHEPAKVLVASDEGSKVHEIENKLLAIDTGEKPSLPEQSGGGIVLVEEIEMNGKETQNSLSVGIEYIRKNKTGSSFSGGENPLPHIGKEKDDVSDSELEKKEKRKGMPLQSYTKAPSRPSRLDL